MTLRMLDQKNFFGSTVEPPLTDTSIQRTPPNNGQIFSSRNTLWQKVTPPYSGHLSTKVSNAIGQTINLA